MSIALSTLFTTPQDLWDTLSVEGVDLREDDHSLSSGQAISVTADSAVGALVLAVAALPVALLSGAWMTFDGAGMAAPVQVQLSAAANSGATSVAVAALATAINSGAQARDSGVNAATGARLLVACRKGTSRVKLYCNGRYDDSQLMLCGTACDWATTCAAKWLCTRRAQGCPKSIAADYDEALEEMRQVQAGQLALETAATRGSDWPTMSNVIVNPSYDGMRARVQPGISEGTPTAFGQYLDWNSVMSLNY